MLILVDAKLVDLLITEKEYSAHAKLVIIIFIKLKEIAQYVNVDNLAKYYFYFFLKFFY